MTLRVSALSPLGKGKSRVMLYCAVGGTGRMLNATFSAVHGNGSFLP